MDQAQSTKKGSLSEMAEGLNLRNQQYLDYLKQSGDPEDIRSKILARILDGVADGLIVLDEAFTIRLANLAAVDLAGWQLEDVTRPELRQRYKFFLDEGITPLAHDQEPIVVAVRERRPHEMIAYVISEHLPQPGRWIRAHAAPIFDANNELLGGVTVFTDLTEKLKLQRQRDCLAALITHDIKNHFAAEQMFLQLLQDTQMLQGEHAKLLSELTIASERYMRIADSMLEVFQTNFFGTKSFGQKIDVVEIVKSAIALSALEATSSNVTVKAECDIEKAIVNGLPAVMCHVFHNLIQNAIEASAPGSTVTVRVSAVGETIVVQVEDNGAGMNDEEVATLFNPHKAWSRVSSKGGRSSGFGLYLSHMLVEGQGGNMSCQSNPNKGTKITVSMPILD